LFASFVEAAVRHKAAVGHRATAESVA
jgi:hypothetical protein